MKFKKVWWIIQTSDNGRKMIMTNEELFKYFLTNDLLFLGVFVLLFVWNLIQMKQIYELKQM